MRRRVEDAEPGHDRAGAGAACRLGGGCRGWRASPAGLLTAARGPAGDGRAPAPEHRGRRGRPRGAHRGRLDRGGCSPTYRPTVRSARAPSVRPSDGAVDGVHTSTGAGQVERRGGGSEGHGGGLHGAPRRWAAAAGAGMRCLTAANEQRIGEDCGVALDSLNNLWQCSLWEA